MHNFLKLTILDYHQSNFKLKHNSLNDPDFHFKRSISCTKYHNMKASRQNRKIKGTKYPLQSGNHLGRTS